MEENLNNQAKILVVDDEITLQRLLKINLSKQGHSVKTVGSGKEALEEIEKNPNYDLVLLDVMMPEMSGYQVCRKLREKYSLYELPIMFVTAKFQVQDIIEGFDLGANDYILKPFEYKELSARSQTLINLKRLTQANQKLKEFTNLTKQFYEMTIHDLKNPLTSILIRSDFLQKQLQSEPNLLEHINSISKMTKVMVSLIQEFEEITQIESGRTPVLRQKVSIIKIISEAIERNKSNSIRKNQKINFNSIDNECQYIFADEEKILRVVDNLLSNAIKFSPENEQIFINIEINEQDQNHPNVIVKIKDNGPGLTEEDKKNVFKRFQKLSARPTGGESSSGLGLFIAKEFINMHNGKIGVNSNYGEGAEFYFEINCWTPENGIKL